MASTVTRVDNNTWSTFLWCLVGYNGCTHLTIDLPDNAPQAPESDPFEDIVERPWYNKNEGK